MELTGGDRDGSAPARGHRITALLASILLVSALLAPIPAPSAARAGELTLLALRGFDPVSYFLTGGPRPGSARFELSWGGRVWRFASGANRDAFRDDPDVYAPRLGGYDAAAVLDRRLADADPAVFALIGGRLYLFRDAERRARLVAEPDLIRTAETVWPTLRGLTDGF